MKVFFLNQGIVVACMVLMAACTKNVAHEPASSILSSEKSEAAISSQSVAQSLISLPGYQMIWNDEFDYTGLPDTAKWGNEIGHARGTELQYYTARIENQSVSDGTLKIIARKEAYNGYGYTAASLITRNKFSTAYGRIEARLKLPLFQGSFPAFWTLGTNISVYGWPYCGEIDIFEHLNTENTIYGTAHWDNNQYMKSSGNTSTTVDQFHLYAIEWDENNIKWYVDNTLFKTFSIAGAANGTWELHQPHYLLLNHAVGGDWPGHVVDDSKLPAAVEVDYVRVYKKNLLGNAGFENASLSPWGAWQPAGTATVVTNNVQSGAKAIREQGGQTSIEQVITGLKPNTTYIFGGYGKVSVAGQSAIIGAKNFGGAAINSSVTSTTYQNSFVTFTTGASNTSVTVYFYKPSAGTVYGDDFYLYQK